MGRLILVLAALFAAPLAVAGGTETWGVASVASYHLERNHYCESNLGFGFEHGTNTVRLVGGSYNNSLCRDSKYLGVAYMPIEAGPVKLGGVAMGVTGYMPKRAVYGIVPVASFEYRGYGANLLFIPPVANLPGVIGVQVKFRF